jgi:hypothetical protein
VSINIAQPTARQSIFRLRNSIRWPFTSLAKSFLAIVLGILVGVDLSLFRRWKPRLSASPDAMAGAFLEQHGAHS